MLLVAVLAVSLTSCARGSGTAGGGGLSAFYQQKLDWGGCSGYAVSADDQTTFADPNYQCARLRVPLDYRNPDGQAASLAVLRKQAPRPDTRIGSLVIDPGGPGASGTSAAAEIAGKVGDSPLVRRFDFVGFDPRGVGASRPAISCFTAAQRDADRLDVQVDTSPAGVARLQGKERDYDGRCGQGSGGDPVLANVGTRDAARDMDILRAALGDDKLTYLGYSYGTELGTAYAEAFPTRVRALVLDGAIDPAQNASDRQVAQVAGFQHAFDAFAAWCTGQPDCPLGHDPAGATDSYRKLVLPVIEHPLALPDGRKLSYDDAIIATTQALYSTQLWDPLKLGLGQLAAGQGRVLMLLADMYYGRQSDGSYTHEIDAFNAISCVDANPVRDPAAALRMSRRDIAAAPFEDNGRGPSPALDQCAFWPVPNTSSAHLPRAPGLPPVMVVAVTGDPATPYQAGENLARDLNARLLTVQGTQHTVALQGTPCVDDAVTAYLVTLTTPPEGTRCVATTPS